MLTALVIGVWVAVVLLATIVGFMNHFVYELDLLKQRLPKP